MRVAGSSSGYAAAHIWVSPSIPNLLTELAPHSALPSTLTPLTTSITEPPSGRCGIAAFETRKGPVRLASMTSLHSSSGYSSILTLGPSRPALLTSTSIFPKRSTVSPTILSTSALFDTSAARARTSAPASSTSSATGPIDSSLRALIPTLAPSLAKASARALPRPWLAPVMSVTLSSSMFLPFGSISAHALSGAVSMSARSGFAFACQRFSLVRSATRRCSPLPSMPSADLLSSVKRCACLRQELEDVLGHGAHLAALVGDLDIRARPQVLLVDLGDSVGDRYRVPDKDRPYKPDAVVAQRDGLAPRLLDHERRGRRGEAYGEHTVGDALLVWRP